MIPWLGACVGPWLGSVAYAAPPAAPPAIEAALTIELDRAMKGLRLPDSATPYLIQYDVLDGDVASYFAELGAVVSEDVQHYRNLRAEVRVGSYQHDSSNFSAFGEPGGVVSRSLPDEDDVVALRREVWLATDDAYKGAVGQLSRKDARLSGDPTPRPSDYEARPPVDVPVDHTNAAAHPIAAAALKERVVAASGWLGGYPAIEIGQAVGRDWQGRRLLLTSEGTRLWRDTGYAVVRVEGTARMPDGVELRDSRSWIAPTVGDLRSLAEMEAGTRAMSEHLVETSKAPAIEDSVGPVVFEGSGAVEFFSQLLAGEVVGTPGELSADDDPGVSRGGAVRLGRRLLPEGWSVVDDATRAGSSAPNGGCMGAYAYDQEGVAPRVVELIRDGVLRDLLMSRIPSMDRPSSTGHGRSLGADRRAAMPACVTVTPPRLVGTRRLERRALRLAGQTGRDFVLVVSALEPPALSPGVDITFTGEAPLPGLTHPYEVYRLYGDGRREVVRAGDFVGVDRRVLRDIVAASAGPGPVDLLDGPPGPGRYQVGNSGGLAVTWDVPGILVSELEITAPTPGREPRVIRVP